MQISAVTEQDVVNCQDDDGSLQATDIILHKYSLNFGCGEQNPVEVVQFYKAKARSTLLMPEEFSEYYVRLFVKEEKNQLPAQRAF